MKVQTGFRTPHALFLFIYMLVSFQHAVAGNGNTVPASAVPASITPSVAGDNNTIPSVLRSATVYRSGAELVHAATATLQQGNNELIIGNISNTVDINSIQIGCTGSVTIMSVEFSKEFLKPELKSPLIRRLEDSLETVRKDQERTEVQVRADNDLLELLRANKEIRGTNTGLSVSELMKMMDYYKQKSLELQNELSVLKEKEARLNKINQKLEEQILEEDKKNTITSGRIHLQVLSATSGTFEFTVSYLTPNACWTPSYDLRVDNIDAPLKLLYKARLVQTSGIDWRQVKLTLSTSVPNLAGNAPVLTTWFLGFVEPLADLELLRRSNTLQSMYKRKDLTTAVPSLQDVALTGDGAAKKSGDELGDYVSVRDNQMNVVFDIDIPYDVPTNGKEQNVVLKEYTVPSTYKYYSAPRLDKDAYLLGELPDWGKLNLLPGEANIIFEGTYIGKSHVDPNSTQDTLNLTLGRDKRVVVKREKLVDYSSVKFMGGNKKQILTYEITVKNNKKQKIQLLLKDQYPLSTNKEIEGELLDGSGAAVNAETGVLTWKLYLEPEETKKMRVSYSVRYPKDKIVNIN